MGQDTDGGGGGCSTALPPKLVGETFTIVLAVTQTQRGVGGCLQTSLGSWWGPGKVDLHLEESLWSRAFVRARDSQILLWPPQTFPYTWDCDPFTVLRILFCLIPFTVSHKLFCLVYETPCSLVTIVWNQKLGCVGRSPGLVFPRPWVSCVLSFLPTSWIGWLCQLPDLSCSVAVFYLSPPGS